MPQSLTYAQAAAILGCHVSNIPKLIRKGDLTSTGRRGASLDRAEVEALAEQRRLLAEVPEEPKERPRIDHRPNTDHEWLSPGQVAELIGVTKPAVQGRINRGRLPATKNGGRFWVRRDLLEQVEAARLVRKTRRP